MAKEPSKTKPKVGLAELTPTKKIGWGVFWSILSSVTLLSLIDYDPQNIHTQPHSGNSPLLGRLGVETGRYLFSRFGLSAWLFPWLLGVIAWLCFNQSTTQKRLCKIIPLLTLILSVSIIADLKDFSFSDGRNDSNSGSLNSSFDYGSGGALGSWIFSGMPSKDGQLNPENFGYLRTWFGVGGSWIFALLLLFSSLAIYFSLGLQHFEKVFEYVKKPFSRRLEIKESNTTLPKEASPKDIAKSSEIEKTPFSLKNFFFRKEKADNDPLFGDVSKNLDDVQLKRAKIIPKPTEKKLTKSPVENLRANEDVHSESTQISEKSKKTATEETKPTTNLDTEKELDGFKVVRAEKTEKATNLFPERKGDYHFPTLELLMEPPEEIANADEDHMIKASRLKETLAEFKIEVELGEVHTGPVITRYDIHPAAGVRVEKIANLDKNLAMALRSESVRILAPVPGKGCVGVEVPNALPAPVCLKEILQSKAWADANAEIPIVLGKEASGKPLVADLTKMPHLLVAGSTGSGKTVCINAIIASLCYHSSPEDVRFIMVDPKIVEMKVYNDLPHMLIPVVTEPKKVPGALKWLLVEMERRYQIFSKVGVRNIAGFNAKILKDKQEKEKAQQLDAEMTAEERAALSSVQVPRDDDALEIPENKLPYIVCIIDELADLMMVAQADVETGIARLAQLARAAGIHLIIATQRPSVNVITGVIKANLPSRISFRVASYRDSQTILDGKGAESLIGKGDMLFIPPGSASFMRAQGAFVSDEEINGIVDYLKVNGPPQIIEEVREQIESAGEDDVLGGGDDQSDDDPMLKKAVEIIRTTKRASTSNLQRKLSIGYNRAARIMDELEERGVVGPDIPGQGREILLDI